MESTGGGCRIGWENKKNLRGLPWSVGGRWGKIDGRPQGGTGTPSARHRVMNSRRRSATETLKGDGEKSRGGIGKRDQHLEKRSLLGVVRPERHGEGGRESPPQPQCSP